MIHAEISHLENSFRRHNQNGLPTAESRKLLLFYAVECGLKALVLRGRKGRSTEDFKAGELRTSGHDLQHWAKELKMPATHFGRWTTFGIQGKVERLPASRAHEAWRYGIDIQLEDDEALEACLQDLWQWAA